VFRILGLNYKLFLKKLDYNLLMENDKVKIGEGSYNNGARVWNWDDSTLEIGKYCSIAFDVDFICDMGFHNYYNVSTYPFIKSHHNLSNKKNIIVGNDVWIGMGAKILPGIKIGNGAIIGANSVINFDVPDYAIVLGNPSRVVKYRFDDNTIQSLLKIAWWNWPKHEIEKRREDFIMDVKDFIEKYN
jgi:virginiamycin A acetyltransferase